MGQGRQIRTLAVGEVQDLGPVVMRERRRQLLGGLALRLRLVLLDAGNLVARGRRNMGAPA
jgi:hypothetical protein